MSASMIALLMLTSLIVLIILGYPIALVLGGVGALFGLIFVGPAYTGIFVLKTFGTFMDYILVAVPLFICMGIIIEKSGLASKLFDAMYLILGRLNGGMALATMVTCTIFAAATGVIGASVVTMGLLALPTMMKYKYDKALATGTICAGGTLGILIPPSVLILIYGPMAGLSVGKLFMGAFIPGLTLSAMYILYIVIRCKINPELGPGMRAEDEVKIGTWKKIKLFCTSVLPVGILILSVLGSIFFGLAAATEAAAIGCAGALILAVAYKSLNRENIKSIIHQTVKVCSMVYLVIVGASVYTGVFLRLGCSEVVKNMVVGLPLPSWGIIFCMFLIVFLLGMFIDWIGIIMIVVPLFTPIAATLGYNEIWFAMMIMIVMQTSFLTPPFAYSIFYLKGIAPPEITTWDIYKGVVPFIIIQIIGVILFAAFPQFILWLPSLMVR